MRADLREDGVDLRFERGGEGRAAVESVKVVCQVEERWANWRWWFGDGAEKVGRRREVGKEGSEGESRKAGLPGDARRKRILSKGAGSQCVAIAGEGGQRR